MQACEEENQGHLPCKLCHWAYHPGAGGATPNALGVLTALAGRPIIPPADPALRPAPANLAAHRRDWRLYLIVRCRIPEGYSDLLADYCIFLL